MGYVFPREPVISGAYRLEHHKGRNATRSYVGDVRIFCNIPSYYVSWRGFSGSSDCSREQELSGVKVWVEQVKVPNVSGEKELVVVKITSQAGVHLEISDERIRELWLWGTAKDASSIAIFIWIGVLLLLFFYIDRFGFFGFLEMKNNK